MREQLQTRCLLRVALAENRGDLDRCFRVKNADSAASARSPPAGEAVATRGARAQSQDRSRPDACLASRRAADRAAGDPAPALDGHGHTDDGVFAEDVFADDTPGR